MGRGCCGSDRVSSFVESCRRTCACASCLVVTIDVVAIAQRQLLPLAGGTGLTSAAAEEEEEEEGGISTGIMIQEILFNHISNPYL
jgi:hypothetical protein